MFSTGNPFVDAMGQISFEGNIIPMEWFEHIRFPNGKPDTVAIILLADIVYWYRPRIDRDEVTGRTIGWYKRFKNDLLQKSHSKWAEQFGFTKRQVLEAILRLEKSYGLITRVRKPAHTAVGMIPNVLYIQPNVEAIKHVTFERSPCYVETEHALRYNVTLTEINTETTTETKTLPPYPPKGNTGQITPQESNTTGQDTPLLLIADAQPDSPSVSMASIPGKPTPSVVSPSRRRTAMADGVEEVLAYLNARAHRHFTVPGGIPARLKDGHTVDDCKRVIDWVDRNRNADWKKNCLNQVTPFRPANFDKYLASANAEQGAGSPSSGGQVGFTRLSLAELNAAAHGRAYA